jgi:plasmid stabilization system protein ParE
VSYWLHPDAEAELAEAALYYAKHASRSVAEAFLAEFEQACDRLVENQLRGPRGDGGLRVLHFDRFPYTLVYEPDTDYGPQVYAVAHQHREPGYWRERL